MDSVTISTELSKINNIHQSLNETNPITYIIFQETFRDKLSEAQMEYLDYKIADLNHKLNEKVHKQMSNIDVGLAMAPIHDKYEPIGYMKEQMDGEST
jgi:hypothetical protein